MSHQIENPVELGGAKHKFNHNKTQKMGHKMLIIGKIYADWCGHCRILKPEWNKMKYNIKNHKPHNMHQVRYIEIEQAQEQPKVDKVNKIYLSGSEKKLALQGGYPTIFKITQGMLEYYNGPRNAEMMQKWALHHMGGQQKEQQEQEEQPVENKLWNFNIFGGKTRNNRKLKRYPKRVSVKVTKENRNQSKNVTSKRKSKCFDLMNLFK
jgi:thiol-disulfide isomerase/thioredoxin